MLLQQQAESGPFSPFHLKTLPLPKIVNNLTGVQLAVKLKIH